MNRSINTYRFFVFLLVFFFHTGNIDFGYLGVQAFFVLSGFLITPILIKTKQTSTSLFSYLKNFWTRRFLRIFPLYYLYLTVLFLTILIFGLSEKSIYFESLKNQLIYGFTYTYNFYHQSSSFQHNAFISHFWSLAVEEQFYIFWPFLIYFCSKKNLNKLLLLICFISPLFRILTSYCAGLDGFSFLYSDINLVIYVSTFSHLDAFAIGGLFALKNTLNFSNKLIFSSVLAVIGFGILIDYICNTNFNISSFGYPSFMKGSFRYVWGYSILNILFAIILIGLKNRTLMRGVFENKALSNLGLISYGLYVYHFGLIWIFKHIANKGYLNLPDYTYNILALITTVIISYISYHIFEKYFIQLKEKIAPKK